MEFKKYKMKEISSFSQGKQVEVNEQYAEKSENRERFIRIVDYTNENEPIRYVKNFGERYYAKKNDLVMIRYGSQTAGKVVMGKEGIIANNMFKINLNNEIILNKYMYYYLSQKEVYKYIRNSQSSSTMPALNFGILNDFEIKIPNIEEQKRTIKILSLIDKKIDKNNHTNDNLHELANTLIDNIISRSYEFEKLKEILKFVKGKKPNDIKEIKNDNYLKYLTIACLNNQEINYASQEKTVIVNKDLLMVMDGASSGDIYYSEYGIVGSTLAKLELVNKNYKKEYVYFLIKKYNSLIKNKNTGSAIPHTDKVFVGNLEIPKINLEDQKILENLLNKIFKNSEQNKTLIKLRDTLLPKLMNGEIDLKKIEI